MESKQLSIASADECRNVLVQSFKIPNAWTQDSEILNLFEKRWRVKEDFLQMEKSMKKLGYLDNKHKITQDYMHYMIQDLLTSSGETFITQADILSHDPLKSFFKDVTPVPNFVVQSSPSRLREKPLIISIYAGDIVKGHDHKIELWADFVIVTPYNVNTQLKSVFSSNDLAFLQTNVQTFLNDYYYWSACMKQVKEPQIEKGIGRLELASSFRCSPAESFETRSNRFLQNLVEYASLVMSRKGL